MSIIIALCRIWDWPRKSKALLPDAPLKPGDLQVQLSVNPTPPEIGQSATATILLHTSSGAPVSGAQLLVIEAVASFTSGSGMLPVSVNATEHGAGRYIAGGLQFLTPDSWVVTVSGHLSSGGAVEQTFYTTGAPVGGNGWLPLNNPVPVTNASVTEGGTVYMANCAVCHGQTGRGDGPAARGLFPQPADLSVHVPMHPQGMLWYWISQGIARTAMPSWKSPLSAVQRWDVVNYLRHRFASNAAASVSPTPASAGKSGPMQFTIAPNPPTLGPARIQIALQKADGTPVTDATVSVAGLMTSMNMAPLTAKLSTKGGGRYVANSFPFVMTGPWRLQFTARLKSGQQIQQTFDIQVK